MIAGWTAGLLLLAAAQAAPLVTSETVRAGPVRARLAHDPASLVLLHVGGHAGSLEPCGCERRPVGGLARLATMVEAIDGAPELVVHLGDWLADPGRGDGTVRPEAALGDAWTARGLAALPFDAVNLAAADLAGLGSVDPAVRAALPLVSAEVDGPGVARWRVIERGGLRVGVTGVGAEGPTLAPLPEGYRVVPGRAREVVRALAEQADVVVVLSAAGPGARRFPEADVVLELGRGEGVALAAVEDRSLHAVAADAGARLGELRLTLVDGVVTAARDRQLELGPEVPADPRLGRIADEARAALELLRAATGG